MAQLTLTKKTGDYWSFVLDGDIANEILNTRNDLLTIGDQCHFKTANGANILQKQDIKPTDVTIIGSGTFNPTTVDTLFSVLKAEGYFDWMQGTTGAGGVDRFTELTDTFTSYVGKDGMAIVVDETQLRLIAVPFKNVTKSTDLSDMPQGILRDKMLITNPTGDGYILSPLPEPPITYLNAVGFFVYDDLATRTTPLPFVAGVRKKLTNDILGLNTNLQYAPYGVSKVWNQVDNQIDFSELALGDVVTLRLAIEPTTTAQSQNWEIILILAVGSGSPLEMVIFNHNTKPTGLEPQTFDIQFGIGSQDVIDFPAELYILSDGNGTITTGVFYFSVLRANVNIIQLKAAGLPLVRQEFDYTTSQTFTLQSVYETVYSVIRNGVTLSYSQYRLIAPNQIEILDLLFMGDYIIVNYSEAGGGSAVPTVPDATTTVKGKIKLSGNLGGVADTPIIVFIDGGVF